MRKLTYNQIQDIADYFNRIMFVQQNEKMDFKKLFMLTSSIGGKARLVDTSKKDESTSEISWKEGICELLGNKLPSFLFQPPLRLASQGEQTSYTVSTSV